jgi:hypothetical protein
MWQPCKAVGCVQQDGCCKVWLYATVWVLVTSLQMYAGVIAGSLTDSQAAPSLHCLSPKTQVSNSNNKFGFVLELISLVQRIGAKGLTCLRLTHHCNVVKETFPVHVLCSKTSLR